MIDFNNELVEMVVHSTFPSYCCFPVSTAVRDAKVHSRAVVTTGVCGTLLLIEVNSSQRYRNGALFQHSLSFPFTPFATHFDNLRNHLHSKSDNNAKIRSFAPIDIQLRDMHPPKGYLNNCKHSIKFQDFH